MDYSAAGKKGWEKSRWWRDNRKILLRNEYEKNPVRCHQCHSDIPYDKRRNKYCSSSCAASHNNRGVRRHGIAKTPCPQCGALCSGKYCSQKCFHDYEWLQLKSKIDVEGFGCLPFFSKVPKRYLLETRGCRCEICGNTEWNAKPIPLVLDHINGNADDWRKENVRLICPNCDAQTPTFTGRNKGNGRKWRRERYKEFGYC